MQAVATEPETTAPTPEVEMKPTAAPDTRGALDFMTVDYPEPHRTRGNQILKRHPEVRKLFGRNPWTFGVVFGTVMLQFAMAFWLRESAWWLILIAAWCVGAFANHALSVMIHECAHNLIFPKKWQNQLVAIFCNIPFGFPMGASFCLYHLKHHQYQGDMTYDADLPGRLEAKMVGNTFLGKFLWEIFFSVFQSVRTIRFSKNDKIKFYTKWVILNIVIQFSFDAVVVYFFGWPALLYFLASLIFAIGPHPLGARWIQEHFIVKEDQETYSYYGPLNTVAMNVGFHNEHHDFPFVSWDNLPKLKKMVPAAYDSLYSHKSWFGLWLRFLFDPRISLYSRIIRDGKINLTRPVMPKQLYAPETFVESTEGATS